MLPASALAALWVVVAAAGVSAGGANEPGEFFWPGALAADAAAVDVLGDAGRLRAIERLAATAGPAATPLLLPRLADPDPGVRLYTARHLSRAGEPAAIAAAITWVRTPTMPQIDRPFGLEILRDASALPPAARQAVELALHDAEPATRSQALEVLERHELGSSLPLVLAALEDEAREVRLRAIRVAGSSGDPRAALSLLARLEDGDHQVRLDAIRALGGQAKAGPALLRVAAEADDDARLAAIDALGRLPGAASEPTLAGFARRRPVDEVARHAQLALGRLGSPAALGALVALLRSPPVADETKLALRRAGPLAGKALARELEIGTPTSATVAVGLLAEIGDARARAPLEAALARRPEIALAVLEALGQIGDPAALPALAVATESPEPEARVAALTALAALHAPRASAVLDRTLADPDPRVRERAAQLAAAVGTGPSTPALAALVTDGDRAVRRAAASALARVGLPSRAALAALLAALARPDAPSRDDDEWQMVGDGLGRISDAGDADRLATSFAAARGGERLALERALAVAGAPRPLVAAGLAAALVAELAVGGRRALAAADALAVTRIPDGARRPLTTAFKAAEPALQARLCETLAGLSGGGAWLGALVSADREPSEVRAAAAWAARGLAEARPALARASEGADGPVAVNARAAQLVGRTSTSPATETRLRASDGSCLVGRWISISGAGGVVVWAMTDEAGAVRLDGLPDGALALRVAGERLRPDGP